MPLTREQSGAVIGAIWLIGFGVLFATRAWFPGILFLIALTALAQGLMWGRSWPAIQGAFWLAALGLWALFRFNVAILFVVLGLAVLARAFFPGPSSGGKPYVDNSLE